MYYKPIKYTPEEMLKKIGFVYFDGGRGYQLPVGNLVQSNKVLGNRMHAYIEGDEINFHHDKPKNGKHVSSSFDPRCRALHDIMEYLDGIKPNIHPKNRFLKTKHVVDTLGL